MLKRYKSIVVTCSALLLLVILWVLTSDQPIASVTRDTVYLGIFAVGPCLVIILLVLILGFLTLLLSKNSYRNQMTNLKNSQGTESKNETRSIEYINSEILFELLINHFDQSEIKTLCFRLHVDYDMLKGEGKDDKARELVKYLDHRGRINDLKDAVNKERPHIFQNNTLQKTMVAK